MEKITFKLTHDEVSVIMKVIKDYIEAATKRDRKDKDGIFLDIEDIFRFFKYEELRFLFQVIAKFGGDDYCENKVVDWYIDSEG